MNATRTRKTSSKKTARSRSRSDDTRSRKTSAGRGGAKKSASRKAPAKATRKTAAKRSTASKSRSPIGQAIEMLEAQHKEAQKLFRQGEKAKDDPDRLREIVEQCCAALLQHAQIEEQYFYPVMHENSRDASMIDEAEVEHASTKQLIEQLQGGDLDEERYAATYKVLAEYTKHHIKEEEKEIFPRARRMRADWQQLLDALNAAEEQQEQGGEAGQRGGKGMGMGAGEMGATGEGATGGSARADGREGELLGGAMLGEGAEGEGGGQRTRRSARRTSRTRGEAAGEEGMEEGSSRGREQDQDEAATRGTRSGSR